MQDHASADSRSRTRSALIAPVLAIAWTLAVVLWALYRLRVFTFQTASRLLALVPGAFGIRARRYWYRRTLSECGDDLVVDWLTAMKTPQARIGRGVYIGSMCSIAEVEIRDDVMIGSRCAIQGGGRTHGTDRLDVPMRQQPGTLTTVVIGPDAWIGTGATVLADVARGTVVAAGAVVTDVFPPCSILGGVPARVLRQRSPGSTAAEHV